MTKWKRVMGLLLAAVLTAGVLAGGAGAVILAEQDVAKAYLPEGFYLPEGIEPGEEQQGDLAFILEEGTPLTEAPVAGPVLNEEYLPEASGEKVRNGQKADIDYSNTDDGYVMVRYRAESGQKIKAQVKGPTTTYTYDLVPGSTAWTTFPLSEGDGQYTVAIYENISGNRYSSVMSITFTAKINDEFAAFLRPNQYVNYVDNAEQTVLKAAQLCAGLTDPLDKVSVIYDYVVKNLTYDYELAATVQSGYLPVLDTVLAKGKGICFDYASMMTAMLRSQGVPCKLVVGYAGTIYHAWISVWTQESGWINAAIYFDGISWQRMDPTFASTGRQSQAIMQYIGDGPNYTVKYLY